MTTSITTRTTESCEPATADGYGWLRPGDYEPRIEFRPRMQVWLDLVVVPRTIRGHSVTGYGARSSVKGRAGCFPLLHARFCRDPFGALRTRRATQPWREPPKSASAAEYADRLITVICSGGSRSPLGPMAQYLWPPITR